MACATYSDNLLKSNVTNIVLGSHLINPTPARLLDQVPVVLYNLEQLPAQLQFWKGYDHLLQRHMVWDYDTTHLSWMERTWGTSPKHLPLGYVPTLTRLPEQTAKDIDVLFYGSMSPRRQRLIENLQATGLKVVVPTRAFGIALDALIARSRVVINIHQYSPNDPIEQLRLLYLWANRTAVVSEIDSLEVVPPQWQNAALWTPYQHLIEACHALLANESRRDELGHRAYSVVREQPFEAGLRALVCQTA